MKRAVKVHVHRCVANDKIVGPTGTVIYQEPALIMNGWQAWAYFVGEAPVGVLIFRGADATLRYCETDGSAVSKPMPAGTPKTQMLAGLTEMAKVISRHLGERHPVAQALAGRAAKPEGLVVGTVH